MADNDNYFVDDLTLYKTSFAKKYRYYMLSDKKKCYLKLNENQYHLLTDLLPHLKKITSLNYYTEISLISKRLNISKKYLVEIISFLESHKLEENNYDLSKNEIEFAGKKIFFKDINELQKKHGYSMKIMHYFIKFSILLLICTAILLVVISPSIISETVMGTREFNWKDISIPWILLYVVMMLFSVLFHELGHMVIANAQGFKIHSFTIILKYYVTPIFFIRYVNFYKNGVKNRIFTLLGGAYFNLYLSIICFILLSITDHWFFALLGLSNVGIIISTLSIIGITDGYFILTNLLGLEGLRMSGLTFFTDLFKNRHVKKGAFKQFLFVLITYVISITQLFLFISIFIQFFFTGIATQLSLVVSTLFVIVIVTKLIKDIIRS